MTKMVLGRPCCEKCPLQPGDITLAQQRMERDFAFVGLQHEWAATVHSFHALYGGKLFLEELETRRANQRNVLKAAAEEGLGLSLNDYADEALYETAQALFRRQLRKVQLLVPDWNRTGLST